MGKGHDIRVAHSVYSQHAMPHACHFWRKPDRPFEILVVRSTPHALRCWFLVKMMGPEQDLAVPGVDNDQRHAPNFFKIMAIYYEDWHAAQNSTHQAQTSEQSSRAESDGTDKHRLLLLCPLPQLIQVMNAEVAPSAPAASLSAPPGLAQRLPPGQQGNSWLALPAIASKLW